MQEAFLFHRYFKTNYDELLNLLTVQGNFSDNSTNLRLATEIAQKHNLSTTEIIMQIQHIQQEQSVSLPQALHLLRMPFFSALSEKYKHIVGQLQLPPKCTITTDQSFEKNYSELTIQFSTKNELIEKLEKCVQKLKIADNEKIILIWNCSPKKSWKKIMNENYPHFKKIYVENSIKNHAKTKLILARLDYKNKIEYFDDINMLIKSQPTIHHPRERATSLVLSSIRGKVIRQCPGTHGHICCNYFVINQYIGCPIDCNYCILQGYLNQPFTIINVDIEVIFEELDKVSSNMADNAKIRIGTGELGDSLAYDSLTDFSLDFMIFP